MSVCRGVRRVTDMSVSNLQGKNVERIQKKQKNLKRSGMVGVSKVDIQAAWRSSYGYIVTYSRIKRMKH